MNIDNRYCKCNTSREKTVPGSFNGVSQTCLTGTQSPPLVGDMQVTVILILADAPKQSLKA